ncbi:oligosaccharyl transferase, archaeosortase A system-associated [Methanocella sp. CWC-04]|uniref:dolichyl-phosphooligosaccharide-protein glycotransferase n=1 Tax=Methanooceanicella nereidis TaxID=2052831 RepID=A0AAP2RC23_9EURY|nr:oligosaccharyl transferase, archaeosortase A system-associated [Methanocella sp. CWC-04]MCD1294186.1 oligosaccharyl transferase, archaeosortase A system-associated [Methanocella sp. CWC-04]
MAKSSKKKTSASKAEIKTVKTDIKPVEVENTLQETVVQLENKIEERPASSVLDLIKSKISVYTIALTAIIAIMLYIRIVPSYDTIFTTWAGNYVNFAQDDAVYHMRLVHNTVAHFPFRIFYDPFTHYPYGSTVHFGPLFTLMIAFTSIVLGLGSPSPQLIDTVGAFFPAVLGALCAIPTYYIGKKLFSKEAGIFAALTLAFLPGQFLGRSMLGFTDHHIAEVLFATTTIAFLVYALDAAKKSSLSLDQIKNKEYDKIKKPLFFAFLAGISFGCYLLTWPGALLLGFMLFIYFTIESVVDHMKGKSLDRALIVAAVMYLVPTIMVLPYSLMEFKFLLMNYSITQPVILCMALAGIAAIYTVSRVLDRNNAEKWVFPITLAGIAIAGLLVIYIASFQLFELIMAGFNVFAPNSGMLTVAEVRPTYLNSYGQFSLLSIWTMFDWTFLITLVAIPMLAYRVYKHNRPAELMFLVWNIIMLWALFSQNRFAYYFAINAALLTGYFGYLLLEKTGYFKIKEMFGKKVKNINDIPNFLTKNAKVGPVLVILIMLFVAIFPATPLGMSITLEQAKYGPGMGYEWYDTLTWMKEHTPDPQGNTISAGFDFANGMYEQPASSIDRFDYPSSAYGVMSWWDYGHIITYVANRIPNANPFQHGILEENKTYGSAKFFIAQTEDESVENLDSMGSRYVVIDNEMATGKYYAIQTWANDTSGWDKIVTVPLNSAGTMDIKLYLDSEKFYNSMMNKLYYDDCNGLSHYRLVYESAGNYIVTFKLGDVETGQLIPNAQIGRSNFTEANDLYLQAIQPAFINAQGTQFVYDAKPPAKWVKVFEKVNGATITGSAPEGAQVNLSLTLKTGEREFTYVQNGIVKDGKFSFVVPYPTEDMKGAGYSYDVFPISKYTIEYDGVVKTVDVSEDAVMNGGTIEVA